jgi:hypothetical protein
MVASTIGGEKVRVCDAVAEETEKRLAAYMVYEKLGPHGRMARSADGETGGRGETADAETRGHGDAEKPHGEAAGTETESQECRAAPSPRVRFAHVGPLPRGGEGDRRARNPGGLRYVRGLYCSSFRVSKE